MSSETKAPSNHVAGVIGGSKPVDSAVGKLRAGYEDVLIMHRVDRACEGVNPLPALSERLAGHLSNETSFLAQYQAATENGDPVVAVGASQGVRGRQGA